ncbi:MAG: alpha-glucosidase [Lachnospiraceae bacterium]|nr:alpha-glucosidase [Lachnospiraceae bacterium]
MLTIHSKLKDVYASPIGKDILDKLLLQLNLPERVINNPAVSNMKLSAIRKLSRGKLNEGFLDTFLKLVNAEQDTPASGDCMLKRAWWKEAVFYQIYPRSFCDANGDGMGDLEGILCKLDYLQSVGVDAIWLSPIYDSPQDDNGYDIRDYRKIWESFGTMEQFDVLLENVHKKGMRLIMDLVINHTSDEHEWFRKALTDPESKYHDYYIFRKGKKESPPNNWKSFFSGSAWNYYPELQEWGLHLFSTKQMDLNWENPDMRAELIDMIRFWLEKGVDGFRMDVINLISKADGLPDGDETIGRMMGFCGIEHYFYGPKLHTYLKQIRREAFEPYQAFSVGEMPGIGMETGKLLTGDDRDELDMFFCFDHLETPGHSKFEDYVYDLNYLKKFYIRWQERFGNHCWQALFLENHDNPRMVSKVEPKAAFHEKLAMNLLTMQLTLKGTPFIYQGQEMGMANHDFHSIDEMEDIESVNLYAELCKKMPKEEAFRIVLAGSRDHARRMIDWDCDDPDEKCKRLHVQNYLKKLTTIRKDHKTLIYGEFLVTNRDKKDLFTYFRSDMDETWYVEYNLSDHDIKRSAADLSASMVRDCRVLGNYENTRSGVLRPYECNIYWLT